MADGRSSFTRGVARTISVTGLVFAAVGFELALVERLVFRPKAFVFLSSLLKCGIESFQFLLGVNGEMTVPEAVTIPVGNQQAGPCSGDPAQMGTGVPVVALETEGSFLIPCHSGATTLPDGSETS